MICGQCGDQVFYRFDDQRLSIEGNGPMWDFAPEETTAEQRVTRYDTPWSSMLVESAVVSSGVTRIGNGSFCRSFLQSVHLPNTLKEIGSWAFADSDLERVRIPPAVKRIGTHAFFHCDRLRDVLLPDHIRLDSYSFARTGMQRLRFRGKLDYAGKMAFWLNPALTEVKLPPCGALGYALFDSCGLIRADLSGCGLETLPDYLFSCCNHLETLLLPPQARSIGTGCLMDAGLTELVLPASVEEFHPGDVIGSKLKRIVFLGKKAPDCTECSSFCQKDLELVIPEDAEGFDVMPWRAQRITRLPETELKELERRYRK